MLTQILLFLYKKARYFLVEAMKSLVQFSCYFFLVILCFLYSRFVDRKPNISNDTLLSLKTSEIPCLTIDGTHISYQILTKLIGTQSPEKSVEERSPNDMVD